MKAFFLKVLLFTYKKMRVYFYKFISEHDIKAIAIQPVLAKGIGKIKVCNNVRLGVEISPLFYSNYIYLDVRKAESEIHIGSNIYINNNASIISDGCKIKIGRDCLFGSNLQIIDSVIANGSIVSNSIPANVIAAGSPAKVIKNI